MANELKHGGPAFPAEVTIDRTTGETRPYQFNNDDFKMCGMTLRDYFAAKALPGVIGAIMVHECHGWTSDDFARESYEIADAMLKARDA